MSRVWVSHLKASLMPPKMSKSERSKTELEFLCDILGTLAFFPYEICMISLIFLSSSDLPDEIIYSNVWKESQLFFA